MKKKYKIQLPKDKKVTFKEVHLNDGVLTIDVELTGKDENLGFASRKEAEQFIREMDHINYVAWKKFIDKSKDIKEQKYDPKDGDFVCYNGKDTKNIAIFKEKLSHGSVIYCVYNTGGKFHYNTNIIEECEMRPSTEAEKKLLINKLAEKGKRWNEETKTIEVVRWRADYEEEFYYVGCCGRVAKEKRTELFHYPEFDSKMRLRRIVDDDSDTQLYNVGNYFKTREAAEKVAEQIREIFKNSKSE